MSTALFIHLTPQGDGVAATLKNTAGEAVAPPRTLPCAEFRGGKIPLAPTATDDVPDMGELKTSPEAVFKLLRRLASVQLHRDEADRAGTFLFHVLIGPIWWASLQTIVGPKHLYLSFDDNLDDWHQFPWELMRCGQRYLARQQVELVRYLPDAPCPTPLLTAPLRVLFVVGPEAGGGFAGGGHLSVGGEFIGLLRRLRRLGIPINEQLLTLADGDQLDSALEVFQPHVVHFIGHGELVDGRACLLLGDGDGGIAHFSAEALADKLLRAAQKPLVVLNACNSAGTMSPGVFAGNEGASLVLDLVRQGIPLAVGMGGRVRNTVCRLFTRRFYEALLKGESLVDAVAEGRWAAVHKENGEERIDWARPVLARGVATPLQVDAESCRQAQALMDLAHSIDPRRYKEMLCDRADVFARYRLLGTRQQGFVQTLLILETRGNVGSEKMGKSMVLHELLKQIVVDGGVPVLPVTVIEALDMDLPEPVTKQPVLLIALLLSEAARVSRNAFLGLPEETLLEESLVEALIEHKLAPDAVPLPDALAGAVRLGTLQLLKAAVLAVRLDLTRLQNELGKPITVLVDDAHLMVDDDLTFLKHFVGKDGLGHNDQPVNVVVTCSDRGKQEHQKEVEALKEWLNGRPPLWAQNRMELSYFQHENEIMAYQQFLMLREKALVRTGEDDGDCPFLQTMKLLVKGVPSSLYSQGELAYQMCLIRNELREVDDEDRLERYREAGFA